MRKKIIEIINTLGLNIEDFIIGCGAKSSLSIIHYKPYLPFFDSRKEFSVQFCEGIIAIWEIGKRIDKGASIDLSWEGICWKDINELRIKK